MPPEMLALIIIMIIIVGYYFYKPKDATNSSTISPPSPAVNTISPYSIASKLEGSYSVAVDSKVPSIWITKRSDNSINIAEMTKDNTSTVVLDDAGKVIMVYFGSRYLMGVKLKLTKEVLVVEYPNGDQFTAFRISTNPNL